MQLDLNPLGRFLATWPHPVAVVGGLAILLRVQVRATRDIDLVIVAPDPVSTLLPALEAAGFEIDRTDIDEWIAGGLVRARVAASGQGLDLILADEPWLQDVARRAQVVMVGSLALPVASLEDLLLMKLEAARPHDLDDALAIRERFAATLDREYLIAAQGRVGVDSLRFLDGE